MAMLLFVESLLWSIIGDSGFVVSAVVPSAQALLSFHLLTGKMGTRPRQTAREGGSTRSAIGSDPQTGVAIGQSLASVPSPRALLVCAWHPGKGLMLGGFQRLQRQEALRRAQASRFQAMGVVVDGLGDRGAYCSGR